MIALLQTSQKAFIESAG